MYQLSASTVFAQSGGSALWGVSDLSLFEVGGALQLYAVDRVSEQIVTYEVGAGIGAPSLESARNIGGGYLPATGVDLVDTPGGVHAILTGASASDYSAFRIQGNGGFSSGINFDPDTGSFAAITAALTTATAQGTFMVSAQHGQDGFAVQSLDTDLSATLRQSVDTGGAVSDLAVLGTGTDPIVLAADATGHSLLSYRMAANGTLTEVGRLTALDGLAVYRPGHLETTRLDGQHYAILAASGSGSLSVVAVDGEGAMTLTDHVFDGLATRFAGVDELGVVTAGERVFVLAAGNDAGITLLELLPNGRLHHHMSLPDQTNLPLDGVTSLVGAMQGDTLHVYAASGGIAGIAELKFTLGPVGDVATGNTGHNTINGTNAGDVLYGGTGGNDQLFGGSGNDVLVAGSGDDSLTGGAGRDVFVMGATTSKARILDFDPGKDVIDLSGLPFLYDVGQLSIVDLSSRFTLSWGGVSISVYHPDNPGMTQEQLLSAIKIDLAHSVTTIEAPDPNAVVSYFGTAGDDDLVGDVTVDVFFASSGADSLNGGENRDYVTFDDFSAGVKLDLLFPDKNQGELADDILVSIEGVMGTAFQDVIEGDHVQNWFEGGDGNDILRGRSARDRLFGEEGEDTLNGGKGRDRLEGGAGDDLLEGVSGKDFLRGGKGNDTLRAGENEDKLLGGVGKDVLDGGRGEDWLDGSWGNDTLTGGGQHDTFVFGQDHGDDVITDFNANTNREQIDLTAMTAISNYDDLQNNHMQAESGGVLIDTGEGTILLEGVSLGVLDANDFIL
ncbi:MAG: calcium-binding protein [Pseudomonadota bacterium]